MGDPNLVFRQAGEACARGDFAAAVALYRELLAQLPDHPMILSELGSAEIGLGLVEDGVASLRRSLAMSGGQPNAWCNLARGLRLLHRSDEALAAVDRALALKPDLFEAFMAHGNILWDMDRSDEALKSYERAGALRPNEPRVFFNCGNALQRLGQLEKAAGAYAIAVKLAPEYVDAHLARAKVMDLLRHPQAALDAIEHAVRLRPSDGDVHFTRGTIMASLDRQAEAEAAFSVALAQDPSRADAWRWRGLVRQKLRRHGDAVADFSAALDLKPDYPEAEFDRAFSLAEMKRFEEAMAGYDRVVAARPDYDLAAFNRALLALMRGNFDAGWRGYERRWANREAAALAVTDRPRWTGEGDIAGKTILIWSEQGLGDYIHFCRYVPMLMGLGARTVLEAPARLTPLLMRLGAERVIASGEPRPDTDLHCPLMSLPLAFRTTLQTIPANVPYLSADPDKARAFDAALGPHPRIGFVWEGKFALDEDVHRFVPFALLTPLFRRPFAFHALQKDIRPDDAATLARLDIPEHVAAQNDFSDAAALIAAMDLVITVDTAIAHLAGALGRPVWLMLSYVAEWRWLTDRDDCPWYPTMRLFRQTTPDGWAGVVEEVGAALDRRFGAV